MNTHYTYFLILAVTLAGPLALSFDKKVKFYKNWKYLLPSMIIPALLYIGWDIYFTSMGVWSFNDNYIIGKKLLNLPVEEVLFFLVVPYCCIFIYECIRCYFPGLQNKRSADIILQVLAIVLFISGIFFYKKYYTSWTFVFCSLFIMIIYFFRNFFKDFDAISFLVSFAIVLIPFLIVNGFLTAIPVVLYNDFENTGIRIYTIPFEDTFYGMLLVMMDIALFEKIRNRMKD
ncbi:MAG: lycopene cyclase domain-containing protein [Ferruginibacter sp.]